MNKENLKIAKEIIQNAVYVVAITGAGISTASGLKDFRGEDGMYSNRHKMKYPPEFLLSRQGFYKCPKDAYEFYRKYLFVEVEPNDAHKVLAKWEKQDIIKSVITQNIDGLHTKAGSKNVLEIHGSMNRFYCPKCGKGFSLNVVKQMTTTIPRCDECGPNIIIRPDIVLYGENMNKEVGNAAFEEVMKADVIVAAGSTLEVSTVYNMLKMYPPKYLIIINKGETAFDKIADMKFNEDITETLVTLDNLL